METEVKLGFCRNYACGDVDAEAVYYYQKGDNLIAGLRIEEGIITVQLSDVKKILGASELSLPELEDISNTTVDFAMYVEDNDGNHIFINMDADGDVLLGLEDVDIEVLEVISFDEFDDIDYDYVEGFLEAFTN